MIISHVISAETPYGSNGVQASIVFTDSNGLSSEHTHICGLGANFESIALASYPRVDSENKETELQASISAARSANPLNVDNTALNFWLQTDFDRALLIELMSLRQSDLRAFHYSQTFWQNARSRAGNSNGQRATSLDMSLPDYTTILDAYNLAQGSSTMWNTVETEPNYDEPIRL